MHISFCSKNRMAVFCFSWVLGLLLGTIAAAHAELSVVSLMRPAALRRVSIVLLLMWCGLPFLITVWSVMIQRFEILLLLTFCRCFFFGFFLWLEIRAFGSASWLMVPLSRLSDWFSLAVLCWYALACLRGSGKWEFPLCLLVTVIVVVVDYFAVSPYLAAL